MNLVRHTLVGTFAVLGWLIGAPDSQTSARDRSYHAVLCHELVGTAIGGDPLAPPVSGIVQNRSGSTLALKCPILNDTFIYQGVITNATVDVIDGHASLPVTAATCVTTVGAAGGTCGSLTTALGTGPKSLAVNPSVWISPGGWPYIHVSLPPNTGTPSGVVGYHAGT